jgi:ankyrin repeat protein
VVSLLDEAMRDEWGEVMRCAKLGLGDVNECDGNGVSVMHLAAASGRRALVELLLNCGAQLTLERIHGQSALSFAIQTGELSVANTILSHHSSGGPTFPSAVDETDAHGRSLLTLACQAGGMRAVKLLLAHGCQTETVDNYGVAPIHKAVAFGHRKIVRMLLDDGGADIDRQTADPSRSLPGQYVLLLQKPA